MKRRQKPVCLHADAAAGQYRGISINELNQHSVPCRESRLLPGSVPRERPGLLTAAEVTSRLRSLCTICTSSLDTPSQASQ
eukprot:176343-Hanusia_phi.AAC.3